MDSKNNADCAPVHRIAPRRIMRFALGYGGIPLLIGVVGGLIALVAWCLSSVWSETSEWIGSIDDPTERGLAYIAAAIVFHAFFGKSDVDVKVDGKNP